MNNWEWTGRFHLAWSLRSRGKSFIGSEAGGLTPAGADSAYRRSLYRGFLVWVAALFSEAVPPTRRCAPAFPLAASSQEKLV
jgi:hypothetical protein